MLKSLRSEGIMEKKEKPIRTTLYLPPKLWKQCRLEAVHHNTTATDLVVRALVAFLAGMKSGTLAVAAKGTKDAAKRAVEDVAIEALRGFREPRKARKS
jgi:hypothetical protein